MEQDQLMLLSVKASLEWWSMAFFNDIEQILGCKIFWFCQLWAS